MRFYDRVGMLAPVWVDPSSGYRWYSSDQIRVAELIAALRRVGLALPEVSVVLTNHGGGNVLRSILDDHVAHLEQGLASAKSEISQIEAFWDAPETDGREQKLEVGSHDLMNALSSVRFAMGSANDFPALHGILLEAAEGNLRLTATDRYRAAFCTIEVAPASAGFRVILAMQSLDELLELLQDGGVVGLTLETQLRVTLGQRTLMCDLLDVDFPDLSRIIPPSSGASRAEIDREWLQQRLGRDPDSERWLVEIDPTGQLMLESDEESASVEALLSQGNYLSEAVQAVGGEQLSLELNGPIAPLAIRRTDNPNSFSVLMPIRRDQP